jgi:hypothetical protein
VNSEGELIWRIDASQAEQQALYIAAIRQRDAINSGANPFGSYYVFHRNCGTWARSMLTKQGLKWPAGMWRYNALGAGIGGPQDFSITSYEATALLGVGGHVKEFFKGLGAGTEKWLTDATSQLQSQTCTPGGCDVP